ncbi:AIPR family protein [Methanothrix sp.]|uniref:AIPR family protein n=1 Tax=Methanothrix sp. TaxID=90426 RepID=UPI003BB62099
MSKIEGGYEWFHSEIGLRSLVFDLLKEHQFVEYVGEILVEAGEIEECTRCSYQARGLKVDGYYYDSDTGRLYLIAALWKDENEEAKARVTKKEIEDTFSRCLNFFNRSRANLSEKIEIANEAHDLARLIQECRNEILSTTIILITDGFAERRPAEFQTVNGIDIKKIIWDMKRILDFIKNGEREAITIDFGEEGKVPCLYKTNESGVYTSYLAFISGNLLAELYSQWGTRLLEMNLRVFLSARGKVNKGIRETIIKEPSMFCAYNNGITVSARNINFVKADGDSGYLRGATDFQIVNGGQTVASLYHAKRRQKADLSNILVPMKLISITKEEDINTLVQRISEYSNTQNKISMSDLAANERPHQKLHELSKRMQAPDPTGGSRISYWFYERARGSYEETRRLEAKTSAQEKAYDAAYPKSQRFDKGLFGKVWNSYLRKPYVVSLGAQKCFAKFNWWLKEQEYELEPFFKQTVALLILWRDAERIVRKQEFKGYRHNIMTYTLAWLFELTQSRMDLEKIWREQKTENAVLVAIEEMCQIVEAHIKDTNQNVTEWCKKEECWRTLLEKEYTLPDGILACFMDEGSKDQRYDSRTCDERKAEEFCKDKGSKAWIELFTWAKQRNFLTGKARSQCFNMGNFLDRGREPSMALSDSCRKTWQAAELLGWRWEDNQVHRNEAKASQITELADSADNSKIRNQILGLAEKGGIISLVMLLKSIEDKDDYTRCIAAEGLGKYSDPAAVNALINSLKDASSAVRKQSALALGGVGGIRSRPYLIDALKDEDRSVRKAAKKSLSKINRSR